MKKIYLIFAILLLNYYVLYCQVEENSFKSIRQIENEHYKKLGQDFDYFERINIPAEMPSEKNFKTCNLNKIVFGWHPYWSNNLEINYQWNLLSDLCYFSYEVNASTGEAISTHGWATANSVTEALANGTRVSLCVTLFNNHATFFGNSTAQQTLITNLINLVQSKGAHGVNIDFEGVPSSCKDQFTNFLINLSNQMHSIIPGSIVSVCLYAVEWSDVFDEATLNQYIDYFTIMGYDYYYSGSSVAGPTSPLYTFNTFNYNLAKSVNYYLSKGISKEKLVLGLPYYGIEWKTESSTIPSSTLENGSSRTYKTIKANTSGNYSNRLWDDTGVCPYYVYYSSSWYQCFVDDEESLDFKYDFVNMMDIAGIGIWALGYDDGYTQLWDLIRDKFTDCSVFPCSGTFYDLGGPYKDYLNSSDYSFTIAPTGASKVSLSFPVFNVEAGSESTCNYDYIEIFDGSSISSPSLGQFCNTTGNPGTIESTGNSLTVKVHTDATTVGNFEGAWTCTIDSEPPQTAIVADSWQKDDFLITFNDSDNFGVDKKFYQILDFNGVEWRANSNYGFFNDNFNSEINSEWTQLSGTWSVVNGHLVQSDESLSNNNIYAYVNQSDNGSYMFHWQMKLSGSGSNRRAGLYIYCSNPEFQQRENAYMIYFRIDNSKCQIYRCTNDEIEIKTDDDANVNPDVWYDYKVIYNPQTGLIQAYQNNILVSSWTDPNPLTSGNSISLRTGNCIAEYDDIKVYKSRSNTVNASVGVSSEIRYQNTNSLTSACRIKSIITDVNGLFSEPGSLNINIDTTPPIPVTFINDGTGVDIDITYNPTELSANWFASSDPNSYIIRYEYCVGTSQGANDIIDWTNASTNTSFTHTGLNLVSGNTYYTSVKAINAVELSSNITFSDGITYIDPAGQTIAAFSTSDLTICPGAAVQFINQSINANSYQWTITGPENYNSTVESPYFILQAGNYHIQLIAYGDLINDTASSDIVIEYISLPEPPIYVEASSYSICANENIILSCNSGSGDNFVWYENNCGTNPIGSGNNITVSPSENTIYFGRWENQCGVSDCAGVAIVVTPYPEPATNIYATAEQICDNETTILNYIGGSGSDFNWYSGSCGNNQIGTGNNLEVQPTESTIYFGRWENQCGVSDCQQIQILHAYSPIADFEADNTIVLLPAAIINFTNLSQNATSYFWNFGDGNTSNEFEPAHQYTNPGEYTVSLTASNQICGNDTKTIQNYILVQSQGNIQLAKNESIIVTPNPAKDFIVIQNKNGIINKIKLISISGKIIKEYCANDSYIKLDVSNLPTALYILEIETEIRVYKEKISILK